MMKRTGRRRDRAHGRSGCPAAPARSRYSRWRPSTTASGCLFAFTVDAHGGDQCQAPSRICSPSIWDRKQIEPRQIRRPSMRPSVSADKLDEPARDGRLGPAVAQFCGNVALRQADRTAEPAGRDVSAASGSSPICRANLPAPRGLPARQGPISPAVPSTHTRPLDLDRPTRGKPSRPVVRPQRWAGSLVRPPMAWPAEPLAILFHHLRQGSRSPAVRQETVEAFPNYLPGRFHHRGRIAGPCRDNLVHGVAFLSGGFRHPEPNSSKAEQRRSSYFNSRRDIPRWRSIPFGTTSAAIHKTLKVTPAMAAGVTDKPVEYGRCRRVAGCAKMSALSRLVFR